MKNKSNSKNKMAKNKVKVLSLINDAINEVENEIILHEKGEEPDATVSILREILIELQKMKEILSPRDYMPTHNYIIRDSWECFLKLGDKLLCVIQEYKEKLE